MPTVGYGGCVQGCFCGHNSLRCHFNFIRHANFYSSALERLGRFGLSAHFARFRCFADDRIERPQHAHQEQRDHGYGPGGFRNAGEGQIHGVLSYQFAILFIAIYLRLTGARGLFHYKLFDLDDG